ncbi:hypothetical protein [Streptomyces sp. NPDC050534]|jgi:hypothetical protein|uniref:hypothetical protein n=1 Tax=unclassified Streptomyces TaxID=2593676 RepID=UPI00379F4F60
MNRAVLGMLVGMALAVVGYFGGFGAFLLVAALGAVGGLVGRLLDNGVDWRDAFASRDKRAR